MAVATFSDAATSSVQMLEAQQAVGALRAVTLADVPGALALADTRAMMVLSQQISAELLRRLSDVQHRKLFALDGTPTIGTWLVSRAVNSLDKL